MNSDRIREFKQKMQSNGVLGLFMKTADPAFVESAGYAGMDYAILDMEHGPVGYENMQNNIRAALAAGAAPIIRVDSLSENSISKALDIGAFGVQIPQISSGKDAQRAVRMARFHPLGERGVCRFVRAAQYSSLSGPEYFAQANNALIIVQLEGQAAIRDIDAILEVDGIDVIFVGPYDLSQSMGLTGQTTHPDVVGAMRLIIEKAAGRGKITGTFTDSEETLRIWKNAGVKYLSYSVDVGIFSEACRSLRRLYMAI